MINDTKIANKNDWAYKLNDDAMTLIEPGSN